MSWITTRHRAPLRLPARMALALLPLLLLAACGGGGRVATGPQGISMAVPRYTGDESFVWCVPYARQISGVSIRGDADTWWDQASGRYERGNSPRLGSVLTLRPDDRLRSGHVAVVTGIDGPRDIRVSHANWGWNDKTRGRIYENMPARDVSAANDWSQVRFKHPSVNGYGRVYPALGFIHPETRIATSTPVAAPPPTPTPAVSVSAPARSTMMVQEVAQETARDRTARSLQLW